MNPYSSPNSQTRFLIVEDNEAYARAIVRSLRRWGNSTVVGTICDAKAALLEPNWRAIFIDLGLPDGSGLDVLVMAREAHPAIPVLILSADSEPASINRACSLGAHYAIKPVSMEVVEHFVEFAESFGMRLAAAVKANSRSNCEQSEAACLALLSERERQVVRLALLGRRNKEIATELGLAASTVRVLVKRAIAKVGVRSREALLNKYALLWVLAPSDASREPSRN